MTDAMSDRQGLSLDSTLEAPNAAAGAPRSASEHPGSDAEPACTHLRVEAPLVLRLPEGHRLRMPPDGGICIEPLEGQDWHYWLPHLPQLVVRDALGRLLGMTKVGMTEARPEVGQTLLSFGQTGVVEVDVWRMLASLAHSPIGGPERPRWFMQGSHTVVASGADVYQRLVSGTVFEKRKAWPNDLRMFSENDGNALHQTLQGLARASCGVLLHALRHQALEAVLARRSDDGGYRHVKICFTFRNCMLWARRNLPLRGRIAIHLSVFRWFRPHFLHGLNHLTGGAPLPERLRSLYRSLCAAFNSPVNHAWLRGIADFWRGHFGPCPQGIWQLNRRWAESRRK
ncbi:hypothetical protein NMQ14_01530 [Methyloversatilis sp. XJ19-13]|uniref:hypothetical protein n=1 Tax=Methyloversatilis sp. XJ19-13 TaxID=2963430 RepID=UPI00211C1AD2|nr:hypothetical protein [Methyloversatilis sp. XJ19-13]MCQ9372926.1 hypothetical protein [Methyloversatilis sp. XJ19-13]